MKIDWSTAVPTPADATALAAALNVVRTQAEYATFIFEADRTVVTARSSDSVTLVRVSMAKNLLSGPNDSVGIKIDPWLEALKGLSGPVTIQWLRGMARIGDGRINTALALEDPSKDSARVPDLELSAYAMVPADRVLPLVVRTDARNCNCYRFAIGTDGLTVDATDDRGIGPELTLAPSELTTVEGSASATYPWRPWAAMLKALPRGAELMVELDDDYPCRVTVESEGMTIVWLAAPMIVEDSL